MTVAGLLSSAVDDVPTSVGASTVPPSSVPRSSLLRDGTPRTLALFALLALALAAVTPAHSVYDGPVRLARELAQGRTYLPQFVPWIEMYRHDGRDYLAYPPMVSMLLVPWALVTGGRGGQPPFNSLLIFGSAVLLFRLMRRLDGMRALAPYAAIAYVLGTPVLYSAYSGNTWLLMHSEGNFFLLLALVLALARERWFLAGLSFMTAVQTRYVLALAGPVFALLLLSGAWRRRSVATLLRGGAAFAVGMIPPLAAALAFQWWTLGDALMSPYMAGWNQWGLRGPQFGTQYFATNWPVYTYLHPELTRSFPYLRFDAAGQSPFVMSPFFLGVLLLDLRKSFVRMLLPSLIAMQCFYLVYFGSGYAQYGARYAQDFYPLLLPVAFSAFARPGRGWRIVLTVLLVWAVVLNVYGVYVMHATSPMPR
ncbi:hypothetical protein K2Z84_01560 [Candidatus Binatia bacterium]|nr:hypothetical protein [Candidatus Binatia bacterium]